MPFFSIVVPCYNLDRWIGDCLDSVAHQTFTDWECLVIDDGSTDNSAAIIDAYSKRDSRFKATHQTNAGEGAARNTGLRQVQGEWVFFLDGDDVMAPEALSVLAHLTGQPSSNDLIRFSFLPFDDGQALPKTPCLSCNTRIIDIHTSIRYEDYYVYMWQFLYRHTILKNKEFDHYKRGADRTFIIPILCAPATKTFTATESVCYFYRTRTGSAVNSRASVQALKDELSHRIDVMENFDRCNKTISYASTYWLEEWCLGVFVNLSCNIRSYSPHERRELTSWFAKEIARLSALKGFGIIGQMGLAFYRTTKNPTLWAFAAKILRGLYYVRGVLRTPPRQIGKRLAARMKATAQSTAPRQ